MLKWIWRHERRSYYRHLSNRQLLEAIMADLTRLNAAVSAQSSAISAVAAAIDALKAADNQAAVDAAATQIEANNTALSALVTPPSTV